jgi:hypothetical protein
VWRLFAPTAYQSNSSQAILHFTDVLRRYKERRQEQFALNLAAARLRHIAGTAWSNKRYLNIEELSPREPGSGAD